MISNNLTRKDFSAIFTANKTRWTMQSCRNFIVITFFIMTVFYLIPFVYFLKEQENIGFSLVFLVSYVLQLAIIIYTDNPDRVFNNQHKVQYLTIISNLNASSVGLIMFLFVCVTKDLSTFFYLIGFIPNVVFSIYGIYLLFYVTGKINKGELRGQGSKDTGEPEQVSSGNRYRIYMAIFIVGFSTLAFIIDPNGLYVEDLTDYISLVSFFLVNLVFNILFIPSNVEVYIFAHCRRKFPSFLEKM